VRLLSTHFIQPPAEPQHPVVKPGVELAKHRGPSGPKQPQQPMEYMGKQRAFNLAKRLEGADMKKQVDSYLQRGSQQAYRAMTVIDRSTIFKKHTYFSARDAKMVSLNPVHENPSWMKRAQGYKAIGNWALFPFYKQQLNRFLNNVGEVGSPETQVGVCAIRVEQILEELEGARQAYERVRHLNLTDPEMIKAFNFMSKAVWPEKLVWGDKKVTAVEYAKLFEAHQNKIKRNPPIGRDPKVLEDLKKLCLVDSKLKKLYWFAQRQHSLLEFLKEHFPVRYQKVVKILKEQILDHRKIDEKKIFETFHEMPAEEFDYRVPIFKADPDEPGKVTVAASFPAVIQGNILP
jgi:hypothetical protein